MFRKIRIRLVLLNAVVFLIILYAFGAALYFYTRYNLVVQVDHLLHANLEHVQREHRTGSSAVREVQHEENNGRRIIFLVWDEDGSLLNQSPNILTTAQTKQLQPHLASGQSSAYLSKGKYRVLVSLMNQQKPAASASIVEFVYNMTPEYNMLHHLLYIILLGALSSVAIAVLAGFYLASRALIPIQSAWTKQQQFVADASHELRTPLSVAQLHLERLFRQPDHTIEEESESIYEVISESKRMNKLVDSLLTLARSDSNQIEITKHALRLDLLLAKVTEQFRDIALLKRIELHSELTESVSLWGDEERLHQLFVILLDNAVKYSSPGGTIVVRCYAATAYITVEIQDSGVGIAKEHLPFIFDRFYRVDKSRSRIQEGTGLGLSIAHWIIEVHRGKIRVDSVPGEGTCFSIQLPLK